jgi:hypothetical protein
VRHLCCVEISKYALSFELNIHVFCHMMLYCWVSSSWTSDCEGGGTAVLQGVGNCYCAMLRNIQKT